MIARSTKTLTLLIAFFLSVQCKSLAATYYVNINNPTPGAGTTWATAFTDLNQAIAAATSFSDQIWVAQGTYKPTTTTNRSATFNLTQNTPIYGGFNGTETANTQANPAAYPTILSGDIGVPGDATDNSYHVVTYSSPATTNIIMDGFTITGGNANQGYPGITTPSAGNTGGGILEYETNGQLTSLALSRCTLTNNFAVYGGGLGVYGDASMTFFTTVLCAFTNNTAWSGGGIAALSFNVNYSNDRIDMSTFVNDVSLNNQGSAIMTMNTNGTAGDAMLTTVTNCVLYNNPAPQLYNQCAPNTGSLQFYVSIIWNSTAPYATPVSAGNNVLVDMCDLDLVTPISDNLDVDPQFTNAAAGDFHTPHCSPLVDQGFTTDGFNVRYTDPDGNARLLGPKTDIGLYESQLPPSPTASNATYCQFQTASPLTATALTGNSLLWYTVSTGGTGSTTPITPSTSTASPFGTEYYVSQKDALGCEGPRYSIEVIVKAAATAPPTPATTTYCQNATASALTATGTNLLWYTASTGGTGDPTAPTPVTTALGTTTWYVTQTPTTTCESGRTPVAVTIAGPSTQPGVNPLNYCQNTTAPALTATGSNLLWYTTYPGTGSSTAPTPTTTGSGSTDFYVTQTPTGSCESAPATLTVTIQSGATQPTINPESYCQNATPAQLTATGSNLLWYTSSTGGTGSPAAPTPSTTGAGSTNYYVTQTPAGSCESPRATLTVTINGPATQPGVTPESFCQNATSAPLTATGSNLLWYTNSTGGTGNPTPPTPSTTGTGTTTWYVTQTPTGGCESPRATLTVTIGSPATQPGVTPESFCQNATVPALTATGSNLLWYTSSTGGTGNPTAPTPSTTATGTTTWYVTQTPAGSCESTPATLTVTITPTPSAAFTATPACEGKAATITATSTADTYTWDFGADATVTGSGAGPIAVTWANANSYSVTLTTQIGTCQNQIQQLVTVNPSPKVGIDPITTPLCLGADLTLQAYGAASFQWSPATGLSDPDAGNPTTRLQSSIQYVVTGTDGNGCSATAQIMLNVGAECLAYNIPDAFSPNGDGKNDEFRVKTGDIPRSSTLMIFNRFGGKVFETSNINSGWNGTIGSNQAPTGTYVYVFQAIASDGTAVKKQGTIILVR